MVRNYVFQVDLEDINILTINEIKTMFGNVKGRTKKEMVDGLISEIRPIIGSRIELQKWDVDFKTGEYKEYPNFEYTTTQKLVNLCDWWCGVDDMRIYFKKEEYAKEYVDWMHALDKKVKLVHLGNVVE